MVWLVEERLWDSCRPRSKYVCPSCGRRFRNYEARCQGNVWTADGVRHAPTQPVLPADDPGTASLMYR